MSPCCWWEGPHREGSPRCATNELCASGRPFLALGLSFPTCEWGYSEDAGREAGVGKCLKTCDPLFSGGGVCVWPLCHPSALRLWA